MSKALNDLRKSRLGKSLAWNWTAAEAKQEPHFRKILEARLPKRIVEIGTHEGVSTALLAEYAPVETFDILPNHFRKKVWAETNPQFEIKENIITSSARRDAAISAAVAVSNFAFIDGCHLMPDVERDFRICAPTGCVVLHDYWQTPGNWPDVKEFVDRLPRSRWNVEIVGPFAVITPCT